MNEQQRILLKSILGGMRDQIKESISIAGAQKIRKGFLLLDFLAEQLFESLNDDLIDPPIVIQNFLNEVDKFCYVSISDNKQTAELLRCNNQRFPRLKVNRNGEFIDSYGRVEDLPDKNMTIAILGIFKFFQPNFFKEKETTTV